MPRDALETSMQDIMEEVTPAKLRKVIREFHSLGEIEQLRKLDTHKYLGRNMLGVRKFDDWINNLEIGNIMHLNPITTAELLQNLGKHHEFQKDPMLKKLVLMTVAFFSIATEMRMMVQFDAKEPKAKEELKQGSELWHAQSVFFGAYYLPAQCPLVTHVAQSYAKHYLAGKKPPVVVAAKQHLKNKGLQNFLAGSEQVKSLRVDKHSSREYNTQETLGEAQH